MAQSKRARNDEDDGMEVLHLVTMVHFEDGEASRVRHFFAKVPRKWLEGIDTNFVSARVHNDAGNVSSWLLSSSDDDFDDVDEADNEADDEADDDDEVGDKPVHKSKDSAVYKLVERFVTVKSKDLDQRSLWPGAEKRLQPLLRWDVKRDEEAIINKQFMHHVFNSFDETTSQAYKQAKEAIKAMHAKLPELTRDRIEKLRAEGTLRQTMATRDDAVSRFLAPTGCVPLDVQPGQEPSVKLTLHITLTFS